jgi:hypothetical protein
MFGMNTVLWVVTLRRRTTEDSSRYFIVAVMRCAGGEGMGGSGGKHSVILNLGTRLD